MQKAHDTGETRLILVSLQGGDDEYTHQFRLGE